MFGHFGKKESAEDLIDRLANVACDAVVGDFDRFWLRAWTEGNTIEVALFAVFAPETFRQMALTPNASRQLEADLRELWSVHRQTEPKPWTEATLMVSADGKFDLTFGYEPLGLTEPRHRVEQERTWRETHHPSQPPAGILSPALKQMAQNAIEEYRARTGAHDALWHIGSAQSWHIDQDRGLIQFLFADGSTATAPAQIVGSWNGTERRWLWAWANRSILEPMQQHARKARDHGLQHQWPELVNKDLLCDDSTAWELACVAAHLSKAGSVYRASTGQASVFVTYGEVALSK